MLHGLKIGTKNTLTDYHFAVAADFSATVPEPKKVFVDVPGANGQLDFSRALTGAPIYGPRQVQTTLIYVGDDYHADAAALIAYAHGKRLSVWHPAITGWHYVGLVSIGEVGGYNADQLTVHVDADPYMEADTQRQQTITVGSGGSVSVSFINAGIDVHPVFQLVSGNVTISGHAITSTQQSFADVTVSAPSTTLTFSGTSGSKAKVTYTERRI